ncbi:hypothetical protein IJF81_05415 [bacterium]|nr:hypothetical protein [bacterium]
MVRKLILSILFLFIFNPIMIAEEVSNVQLEMRGYDMIEIPTGTFIPVMVTSDISTETCSEGYKVRFLATNDLYMYDRTVIPENAEFYGYVEKVNLPIIGTNASMKIKVVNMVLPGGQQTPMRGYIYTPNNNLIGGEMAPTKKWVKMPHYQSKFKYVNLSARPSLERSMGVHVGFRTGENLVIVLTDPLFITHTLSD